MVYPTLVGKIQGPGNLFDEAGRLNQGQGPAQLVAQGPGRHVLHHNVADIPLLAKVVHR